MTPTIWNRRPNRLRRESDELRDRLLLAAAKLDVFVAALHIEVGDDARRHRDAGRRD